MNRKGSRRKIGVNRRGYKRRNREEIGKNDVFGFFIVFSA